MELLVESTDTTVREIVIIKSIEKIHWEEYDKWSYFVLTRTKIVVRCTVAISDVCPAVVLAVMTLLQEDLLSLCRFFLQVYVTIDMIRESAI
jgi:hypothetical protein